MTWKAMLAALVCLFVWFNAVTSAFSETLDLLADTAFEKGFVLSASSTSVRPIEIGFLRPSVEGAGDPVWRLAQWGTCHLLLPGVWDGVAQNSAKRVEWQRDPDGGGALLLEVVGDVEYPERPREKGEPWPHLLVEQKLAHRLNLDHWESLEFDLEFRLDHCAAAFQEGATPNAGLHTAQISAYWTVETGEPSEPGGRDMFWFGLPIFDARYPIPPGHAARDSGQPNATGKFIFVPPGSRFFDSPTGNGEWHLLQADLLPLLKEGFAMAQERGYLAGAVWENCRLSSFNLGWELPGTYRAGILLKDLSLRGTPESSRE